MAFFTRPRLFLALAVPLATVLGGCAFRTPTPKLPEALAEEAGPVDPLARTEVVVTSQDGRLDDATRDAVSEQAKKILRDSAEGEAALPAVVRVEVELRAYEDYAAAAMRQDGFAAFGFFLLAPAGVTFDEQALAVGVLLEKDGRRFYGRGEAKKEGGIYAPARKRALAVALDAALAEAARDPGTPL